MVKMSVNGTILFYNFIILLVPFLFFIINHIKKYKKYFWYITLFFVAIFLSSILAFRNVGFDMAANKDFYNYIPLYDQHILTYYGFPEIGFHLLNYICFHVFESYISVQILTSFLSIVLILISLYRMKSLSNIELATFYFLSCVFFYFFGLVRMSIAIGFVYNAIVSLFEKKIKSFYILTVFAICFHYSALLVIFIPLILKIIAYFKMKKISLASYFVIFVSVYGITYLLSNYGKVIPFIGRYSFYLIPNFDLNNLKNFIFMLPFAIIFIFCKIFSIKINDDMDNLNIFIIFLCILSLFYPIFRCIFYFVPISTNIFRNFFRLFKRNQSYKIFKISFFVILVISVLILTNISIFDSEFLGENFIPYITI